METTNTTATTFSANTDCTSDGKIAQMPLSLAVVNPIPTARDKDTIVIFLCEKPHSAIICTPDVRIVPNIMIVKRFTTFVIATRPTFCEKEVTGGQPNNPEMAEAYPSHARDPEISLPLISRFRPAETRAVVSPMVSAAETRKIHKTL